MTERAGAYNNLKLSDVHSTSTKIPIVEANRVYRRYKIAARRAHFTIHMDGSGFGSANESEKSNNFSGDERQIRMKTDFGGEQAPLQEAIHQNFQQSSPGICFE